MRNVLKFATFPLGNGVLAALLGVVFQSREVAQGALFPTYWFASLFVPEGPSYSITLSAVAMLLFVLSFLAIITLLLWPKHG